MKNPTPMNNFTAFLQARYLGCKDRLIRSLGGIPRLEKGSSPINAEENHLASFRMATVYYETDPRKKGTFLLYYRRPPEIGGIITIGLQKALRSILNFRFGPRFLQKLLKEQKISPGLYRALIKLKRLEIDIDAIPEGSFVGPNTPVMIVRGPLWQVQLLETILVQAFDYPSGVATRTAHVVHAAGGHKIIENSVKRAPSEEAAHIITSAAIKGGAHKTSHTLSGFLSQHLPCEERIAEIGFNNHAFTESYLLFNQKGKQVRNPSEQEFAALSDWIKYFPHHTCILIDTISKESGLNTAAQLYHKFNLAQQNGFIGIRDDSNISAESILFILGELKKSSIKNYFIILSDGLNPAKISKLRAEIIRLKSARFWRDLRLYFEISGYLARPESIGFVYKLAAHGSETASYPVAKRSSNLEKASFPVVWPYRIYSLKDEIRRDLNLYQNDVLREVPLASDEYIRPLFQVIMRDGYLARSFTFKSARQIAQYWKKQRRGLSNYIFDKDHPWEPFFTPRALKVRRNIQDALSQAAIMNQNSVSQNPR